MRLKELILSFIAKSLFYHQEAPIFSREETALFEAAYADAVNTGSAITYSGPYPKHRLVQYIAQHHAVMLHGSNQPDIEEFETRRQTLYNGEYVDAVFATRDGIWPLFYAVFDRTKLKGNFRNACLIINDRKYYYFSLTRETLAANPWTEGTVYFLPDETFHKSGGGTVSFAEWVSYSPVKPLTRIGVAPEDFMYLNRVSGHKGKESLVTSWLLYKWRVRRNMRR